MGHEGGPTQPSEGDGCSEQRQCAASPSFFIQAWEWHCPNTSSDGVTYNSWCGLMEYK